MAAQVIFLNPAHTGSDLTGLPPPLWPPKAPPTQEVTSLDCPRLGGHAVHVLSRPLLQQLLLQLRNLLALSLIFVLRLPLLLQVVEGGRVPALLQILRRQERANQVPVGRSIDR